MWIGQNSAKNESLKNGFVSDPKNPNENPKLNPDFLGCETALKLHHISATKDILFQ
jgi:hypothetical protein